MRKMNGWKVATIILATVLVVNFALFALPENKGTLGQNGKNGEIALVKPPFLSNVSAATSPGPNFLYQEAGISAYTNVGQTIDIKTVSSIFKTIEKQTSDYIVGTVALPGYPDNTVPGHPETDYIHVYADTNGWIVAYYLKDQPASMIVDWSNYGEDKVIKGTKLETVIDIVSKAAGVYVTTQKYYYDFNYPDANKLMIIIGGSSRVEESTFNLKLPSSLIFYEYSYSLYTKADQGSTDLYVDGNEIRHGDNYSIYTGTLSSSQFAPNIFHTVKVGINWYPKYAFVAIVLVYKE
jgi:hypothetical protein